MKKSQQILVLCMLFILSIAQKSAAQIANHVVISQVYGGGGNTNASYTNDFIELYNPTNVSINLSGWSVQYAGAKSSTWAGTNLTGSIAPYSYYLIQENAPSTPVGSPLPTPDNSNTTNLSATFGKVALLDVTSLLTDTCSTSVHIIDFVGYGSTVNCFEGSNPTPNPSNLNTESVQRKSGSTASNRGNGFDTDNNGNDFVKSAPFPRNSASPAQQPSLYSDYFRTKTSGNWSDFNSWESSSNGTTDWLKSSIAPDFSSNKISILNGHTISTTANILIDQTTIQSGGVLIIKPNVTLSLNDGLGADLTIDAGGQLFLKSDTTGTAKFDNIGTATIIQNGNVTHERYLSAPTNGSGGRSWRLITAPLKGSNNNSIFYNWQNNGVNNGTGIELWNSTGTGSTGNGLALGAGASIYKYNAANNAYVAVTNTTTEPLFDAGGNKAFLAFVSGSYGSGNITGGATATNAHAGGALITGTQNYYFTPTSLTNNLQLIGNPYNCPIDFDKVYSHSTNISKKFWVIDPSLNNIGGYVLVSWNNITATYDIVPTSAQNQYIQTGQAFFVEAPTISAANVQIQEIDKETTAAQTAMFRTNGGNLETFRINLNKTINGTITMIDGALFNCHQNLSNTIGDEDATKFGNFNESISILEGTTKLAIDGRPLFDNDDSIHIAMSSMQQTNYQLELQPGSINAPGLTATLYDDFLSTSTPVSLTNNTIYPFTVTSNLASSSNSRFKILFSGSNPLAIKFVNVNAQKEAEHVNIAWTVADQSGTNYYNVERSANGKSFSNLAIVNVTSQNDYTFTDNTPIDGKNYYRIKAVARSTSGVYSNVVTVHMSTKDASISTYPNPVSGNTIQLNIRNLDKGVYLVHLFSTNGQKVLEKQISYDGGYSPINISVSGLAAGIYQLQLLDNNGQSIATEKLIKQ